MVESDDRLHIPAVQILQQFAIALDSRTIPAPFFRLDATPFKAQAQRVILHLLGQLKIHLSLPPPVASSTTAIAREDMSLLLPAIPLVIGIVALTLVRSGGSAP